jgi:hypothetical protein
LTDRVVMVIGAVADLSISYDTPHRPILVFAIAMYLYSKCAGHISAHIFAYYLLTLYHYVLILEPPTTLESIGQALTLGL